MTANLRHFKTTLSWQICFVLYSAVRSQQHGSFSPYLMGAIEMVNHFGFKSVVRQCRDSFETVQSNAGPMENSNSAVQPMRGQPGQSRQLLRDNHCLTVGTDLLDLEGEGTQHRPCQIPVTYKYSTSLRCAQNWQGSTGQPLIIMHLETRGFMMSSFKSVKQPQVCWLPALGEQYRNLSLSSSSITLNFPTAGWQVELSWIVMIQCLTVPAHWLWTLQLWLPHRTMILHCGGCASLSWNSHEWHPQFHCHARISVCFL